MANKRWTARQENLQALLKQMRTDNGLTQVELANALGVSQSYVSKYESGERRLDILEVQDVCDTCGVKLVTFAKKLS